MKICMLSLIKYVASNGSVNEYHIVIVRVSAIK